MEKDLNRRIGARIRGLRRQAGLTIVQLAELSGIDGGFLAYIELGQKTPSLATAAKIASGLGVRLAALFEDVPLPASAPDQAIVQQFRAVIRRVPRRDVQSLLKALRVLSERGRLAAFLRLFGTR